MDNKTPCQGCDVTGEGVYVQEILGFGVDLCGRCTEIAIRVMNQNIYGMNTAGVIAQVRAVVDQLKARGEW